MTTIRLAAPDDAGAVAAIYRPYVEETVISFEAVPPTAGDMAARIAKTMPAYPWLVSVLDDRVIGYAYAGQHSERAAYRWSTNVSVYIDREHRRRGAGTALYRALFDLLRAQGYANAFAGITLPNPASVGIHESLGFRPIGVYARAGHKFDAWHDVGWWQLELQRLEGPPAEPRTLDAIRSSS
jgi:L-amino acid N-acyltransferase YncA